MSAAIGFLLGRAPGEGSILPGVIRRLEAAGATVLAELAAGGAVSRRLLAMDVVVLRALDRDALDAAGALEEAGVRCCNSVAATQLARDKTAATRVLAEAGLPVPRECLLPSWPAVRAVARGRPVAIKSPAGSRGRGVLVPTDLLPEEPPFPGPYIVQDWLGGDGLDRKLYVVGSRVGGVLRRWPPRGLRDKLGERFEPAPRLRELALAAGEALGLELFGVDVVLGPNGAAIVDVNAFPGYKGVPAAERWVADHLAAASIREERPCAS
mgnify:CR=1 FL=1